MDAAVLQIRSVKSDYEVALIRESSRLQGILMNEILPGFLREGMSEAELTADLLREMILMGHQGLERLGMFQGEMILGNVAFGENSIYPTNFDGPAGMKGMCPAIPLIGDRDRKLAKGDLVYVDIGFGYQGYHSDRTQLYVYKGELPDSAARILGQCLTIQKKAAALLKPGSIPETIYQEVLKECDEQFLEGFMGCGGSTVQFLGHGVGLQLDEYPVIARGFSEPLQKNMVIALEPKKSLVGYGMIGSEDTYLVSDDGGICLTGGEVSVINV